ncbi:unnamed protein product [Prunus armeniaca]
MSIECNRSRIFCPSLCPNYLKPVIYLIRRLLRSRVSVACTDPRIKLRGLYLCPAITTCLQSHEQSSAELTQCCKLHPRELKSRLLEQKVIQLRELPIRELVIALLMLKPRRRLSMKLLLMHTSWDTWTARTVFLLVALSNMRMVSSSILTCRSK